VQQALLQARANMLAQLRHIYDVRRELKQCVADLMANSSQSEEQNILEASSDAMRNSRERQRAEDLNIALDQLKHQVRAEGKLYLVMHELIIRKVRILIAC
jgi:DNA-binding GntR family transcriptional regulator